MRRAAGTISFSIARRQAAVEPGIENTAIVPTRPATARDSIAAAPISSKLSMRNSSPKPSMRLVSSAETASNVVSRAAMPVPPDSSTASTRPPAAYSSSSARTSAGSSGTMR